ncbi:predicted protein [Histoplasma capsulatum H143]|uniref:Uncharacterized protein n=1 Tax=Ajellomyces capsulatus (strain H143) TaxID=544712 RepID=C6HR31_AJECH|nr:predicted protein [Histoplasma capsulatum H143]
MAAVGWAVICSATSANQRNPTCPSTQLQIGVSPCHCPPVAWASRASRAIQWATLQGPAALHDCLAPVGLALIGSPGTPGDRLFPPEALGTRSVSNHAPGAPGKSDPR